MKLINKLKEKKCKENQEIMLDECLLNEEAIPVVNKGAEVMVDHPEGEYIRKEDGVYLRYVVSKNNSCCDMIINDNKEINV